MITPMAFIVHTAEDAPLAATLKKHLAFLRRLNLLNFMDMQQIDPTYRFDDEARRTVQAAEIIMMGMSAGFIANDGAWDLMTFIMKQRIEHQICVIPILFGPIEMKSLPCEGIVALPSKPISQWGNKDTGWYEVAIGVRKAVETYHKLKLNK